MKREQVTAELVAQGLSIPEIGWISGETALGYRNRLRLRVLDSGQLAFFNSQKHLSCCVLEPELAAELKRLLELTLQRPELLRGVAHVELRSRDDRGSFGLALAGKPNAQLDLTRMQLEFPDYLLGACGDPNIACQVRALPQQVFAEVPLDGFWQINTRVNHTLVEHVARGASERGVQRALDLYAGAGNFALCLSRLGISVDAVETHASSVSALQRAAQAQTLPCRGSAERAELACERLVEAGERYDLVVIDAPRAGARDALPAILALNAPHLLVCSCNPRSFARDAALLNARGYRLHGLSAFDMFPQTEHVELLAWLELHNHAR